MSSKSRLQEPFLREMAENFMATERRLLKRLTDAGVAPEKSKEIVRDELRGLYHGLLVMFDGGTSLADLGLVRIVDEEGETFDRCLHEIGFRFWPSEESS